MTPARPAPPRPWSRWHAERGLGPLRAHPDLVTMAAAAASGAPDHLALTYYGWECSHAELDRLSGGVAAYLASRGVRPGDRVAVSLQTSPHFVIAALGVWKLGAILVTMNPMYRPGEVAHLLADSGATAVVTSGQGYRTVVAQTLGQTDVRVRVTADEAGLAASPDPRVFGALGPDPTPEGADDLVAVARGHAGQWAAAQHTPPSPDDVAVLCYTSGTTGPAKGAMLTHANIATTIALNSQWLGTGPGCRVYGAAPLFHVVGLVLELAHTLHLAGTLILPYRFVPDVALEHFVAHRPQYLVCPPTAYTALMTSPHATPDSFSSFQVLNAGGAVLPPAVVEEFDRRFGRCVNNGYGLTETSGACVFAVIDRPARMDPDTSALSNGVPLPGVDIRVVDEEDRDLPTGQRGEILVKGPCVSPGYWRNPSETAHAFRDGWLRTGDIGFFDDEHMLYCVDRKKDMIITSGFKVWPGEVEQALYSHAAVRDAAVVGVPEAYRGESVTAFVTLKPDARATPEQLIAWCRERLAAYKCPRAAHILPDLPRTTSGKILRRELRDAAAGAAFGSRGGMSAGPGPG